MELEQWVGSPEGRGKVRLVRNPERAGLIRSKNRGAEEATGTVLVYLDAHCEVNINWLPPLLAPLHRYIGGLLIQNVADKVFPDL